MCRTLSARASNAPSALRLSAHWFASSKTCSGCWATKAKLPLHVRVFDCDECPLVLDRDVNAARNLAALAAQVGSTGTGVAGDRGARALKARGADRKTRTTRSRRSAGAGRAGGARPQMRKEAPAPSSGHPTEVVVTPSRTFRTEMHGMLMIA
ncbi:zinc ribbon domain-containing protein [Nocardiopsis oceani]